MKKEDIMGNKFTNIKAVIFKMINEKFSEFSFWNKIEPDIAIFCSDLVDPITPEKTKQFVKQLQQIKDFFLGHDISENELNFLKEEMEKCEKTKTISLYKDEDDEVDIKDIEYYSRHSDSTEGIIGIHLPLNYNQLKKLTNGVFKKTGLIKFYISREQTIHGKIIAENWESSQEIPIATLMESKKKDKDTGEPVFRKIFLFGEKPEAKSFRKIKEMTLSFYVYRFLTEQNQEIVLFSPNYCEIGDYIATGVMTKCDDYKSLTESTRLPTKLPFFFAQSVKNKILKYKDHKEFKNNLKKMDVTKENIYNFPFKCDGENGKELILVQPDWFKLFTWSWLLHQKKGLQNKYPLHIMMIARPGTGKSYLLDGLHRIGKETKKVASGSGSTLKSLVPSFKTNPVQIGYLAESNRFALCDEFLRCIAGTRTTKEGSLREDSLAIMNDLLEHQKREVGSGVSRLSGLNMTARIFAATNSPTHVYDFQRILSRYDMSFMSRWLIYIQTNDHIDLIEKADESSLKEYTYKLTMHNWISIVDYLQSFSAKYDVKRVVSIYKEVPDLFSGDMKQHYNNIRHKHHIQCLMDGIVKARCLFENDINFEAKEEDYENLKKIWLKIIGSWINFKEIKLIDIQKRIDYMPGKCQYLYQEILNFNKPISRDTIKEIALKVMDKLKFYETYGSLIDNELIEEFDGIVKPYFMDKPISKPKQQNL